jgi:hypothetical protein
LEEYFKQKENEKSFKLFREMIKLEEDRKIFDKLKVSFLFNNMIKKRVLLFQSHSELDQFLIRLIRDIYPNYSLDEGMENFERECPAQYNILKSCDRAFWIRLEDDLIEMVDIDDEFELKDNIPFLGEENTCQCLFKPPLISSAIPYGSSSIFSHSYTMADIKPSDKRPLKILNLCGTGLRAYAILGMLKQIQNDTKKMIHELFDIVIGTSISGIIALAISQELPIPDISKFLRLLFSDERVIPEEFGEKVARKKDNEYLKKDFYNAARLEACFDKLFGDKSNTLLKDSKKRVLAFIPVVKISQSKEYLVLLNQNIDCDSFTLSNVARLSMCQYQYFGNTTIGKDSYHSAAETACNPIEHVLLALDKIEQFQNRKLLIVSLGAGSLPHEEFIELDEYYRFTLQKKPFDVLHSTFSAQYLNREGHANIMRWILSTKAKKMVTYYKFEPITYYSDEYLNKSDKREVFNAIRKEAYQYLVNDKSYAHFLKEINDSLPDDDSVNN